jgi:iron(III) transport system substrate-binding protein
MKQSHFAFALLVANQAPNFAFAENSAPAKSQELKLISDRTESHLKPIIEAFEKKHGVKVSSVFMDKGLLARLENRPTEADVVVTKDAELLEIARAKKLLQAYTPKLINTIVPAEFRDSENMYFVDAYRARAIFHSAERVKASSLSTYEDLASPKWKGKVCIRSGFHDYNISLFGQFFAYYGQEKAQNIILGIKNNLARDPVGNDREQAKAIMEGKCDIALMNNYYYPIMQNNPEQQAWAKAVNVFYPNQNEKGAFIMRSAAGLTTAKANTALANAFLEFLVSTEAQTLMVHSTYQYPVNSAAPNAPNFKRNMVPLKDIAAPREHVTKFLTDIVFDKAPAKP